MFHRVRFHARAAQKRYIEALAHLPDSERTRGALAQRISYQAGLFSSVATSRWNGRDVRSGVAIAASLAMCNRLEEACAITLQLTRNQRAERCMPELAQALAPFLPELALSMLEGRAASPGLRAALLLRSGRAMEADALLSKALAQQNEPDHAEFLLLATNACQPSDPIGRLAQLNEFLARFSLPALALREPLRAPSPANLQVAEALPSVRGPLVTVLMTAYQAADRIVPAIQGLLGQTYRDIEVVVVDDASTDGTGQLVTALAAQDARVKLLRLPRNAGTFVAKTVGLQHAAGEFVTCHDSDDWSHPCRIERQVAPLLQDRKLIATTSLWVRMQDDGFYYARSVFPLMRLNPASPLFRRREVLEKTGTWDLVRTGADSEFLARLVLAFGRKAVRKVRQPLALGAHRPGSLMTASDTGFSEAGFSSRRLAYQESWTHWHIAQFRAGRRPVLSRLSLNEGVADRPFKAPPEILVPREVIQECLSVNRPW